MPVKTTISENDFPEILTDYDLGEYKSFHTFAQVGTQTTVLLETTSGKFVLKYYENRPEKHILFEVQLFNFLMSKQYPVPAIIKNGAGAFYGVYKGKPYIIIEFVDGEHCKDPKDAFDVVAVGKVVESVAQLHILTSNYCPEYFKYRKVFDTEYCLREYQKRPREIRKAGRERWLKNELATLEFPNSLPKGLCHADLNYGNFLFKNGEIVAVLDFDMSFYTFFVYDIASLIYWWAWSPHTGTDMQKAQQIVSEYSRWHMLSEVERAHIYDALKLITLLGISWSDEDDFENEKKKIEFLNKIGRKEFVQRI